MRGVKKQAGAFAFGKRKADLSPNKLEPQKRSALGDLTNAHKKKGKEKEKSKENSTEAQAEKPVQGNDKRVTRSNSKSCIPVLGENFKPTTVKGKQTENVEQKACEDADANDLQGNAKAINKKADNKNKISLKSKVPSLKMTMKPKNVKIKVGLQRNRSFKESNVSKKNQETERNPPKATETGDDMKIESSNEDSDQENELYQTAIASPEKTSPELKQKTEQDPQLKPSGSQVIVVSAKNIPEGIVDFDKETITDPFQGGEYAEDIFNYYRRRERKFIVSKYLDKKGEINQNMRAVLIDWMVEVQESFELNHETLYLAVRLVDLYLEKNSIYKEQLQLVGTTSLYIAAKYDERCPPLIDDFCYICDDSYKSFEFIRFEQKMLESLNYDIGVPLSYRFLRRYARCCKLEMELLTFARYILEMSLMDFELVSETDSKISGASLLLALKLKKFSMSCIPTLEYYSGYKVEELFGLSERLHTMLKTTKSSLKTIRNKYSHKIFFEVAKTPIPDKISL